MAAIRFPGSVGIGSSGSRTDSSRHDVKWAVKTVEKVRGSDIVEISSEAKSRFEKDNLVRFEKIKMMKEAREYHEILAQDINFRDADLRNTYRLDKILKVKGRLENRFYDRFEDPVIRKMLKKSGI